MATRNIVPRADEEGSIGTSVKTWLSAYLKTVYVTSIKNSADSGNMLLGDVEIVTGDTTLVTTDFHIIVDCEEGDITITLPAATTTNAGRMYIIHRADTYAALHLMYILTVATAGGEFIDNKHTTVDMYSDNKTLTLLCTGTGWTIVSLT